MAERLNPLHYSVPIVDEEGRPTPEFQVKWAQQTRINDSIPELSTAEQVSAVLDKIGSTSGQILLRGASEWGVLSTPGGTTKFLRADGSYAVPPDTTYSVVTDSAAGLAPKLPNDNAKYLDGSGEWSTPAGGGGGGGSWFWLTNVSPDDWTYSGSSHATKGELVTPSVDAVISGLMFSIRPDAVGDIYQASIVTLDGSNNVTAVVQSATWTAGTTVQQIVLFDIATSLTAGQTYGVVLTLTSGTGTSICRGFWPADAPFLAVPLINGGFLTLDETSVGVGDSFSLDTGTSAAATALNLSF